jgi:hypothetical protein
VPLSLRTRILSLRGYDAADMLIAAELCKGDDVEAAITAMLAGVYVAYPHLRYDPPGCYAAGDRA